MMICEEGWFCNSVCERKSCVSKLNFTSTGPPSAYVIIVCLLHKKVSIRQHISVGYMEIEDNQASTEKHEGKLESFAGVAQLVEQLIRNQ